jgi:signal transduction histidine kinase
MAIALLGIGLWAHLGVRRSLQDQMDSGLHTSHQIQVHYLAERGRISVPPRALSYDRFMADVNRLILVRDRAGRILQANVEQARSLPFDSAAFAAALGGRSAFSKGAFEGQTARSIYGPTVPGSSGGAAVIQVAALLAPLDAATWSILRRILATAALGALATLVGASWLARSALAPVREIATQASAVRGSSPGQRITVHGDVQELRGLVQVLNEMLERVDRFSEWHRRVVRDLSHDLKTPITALRGATELALRADRKPEEYRRVLTSSLEEIDRLGLISEAMSLLGRLEVEDLEPRTDTLDLRQPVGAAAARARERTGGPLLHYSSPSDPVLATVDAALIERAVDHLLDNALRHAGGPTRIDLRLLEDNGGAAISVEDDGIGVPDDVLPHLFEPFYRADPARGRGSGPGLGLTVVATIVERHRGRVWAERGTEGGLRVRIELPGTTEAAGAAVPGSRGSMKNP